MEGFLITITPILPYSNTPKLIGCYLGDLVLV